MNTMNKPNISQGNWIPVSGTGVKTENFDGIVDVCVTLSNDEGVGRYPTKEQEEANIRAIAALPKLLEALESLAKIGADGVIERRETGKPMWSAMDEIKKLTHSALLAAGYTE